MHLLGDLNTVLLGQWSQFAEGLLRSSGRLDRLYSVSHLLVSLLGS